MKKKIKAVKAWGYLVGGNSLILRAWPTRDEMLDELGFRNAMDTIVQADKQNAIRVLVTPLPTKPKRKVKK